MKNRIQIKHVLLFMSASLCMGATADENQPVAFVPYFITSNVNADADLRRLAITKDTLVWLLQNNSSMVDLTFQHNIVKNELFNELSYTLVAQGTVLEVALKDFFEIYDRTRGANFIIVIFTYDAVMKFSVKGLLKSPYKDYKLESGDVIMIKTVSDWQKMNDTDERVIK